MISVGFLFVSHCHYIGVLILLLAKDTTWNLKTVRLHGLTDDSQKSARIYDKESQPETWDLQRHSTKKSGNLSALLLTMLLCHKRYEMWIESNTEIINWTDCCFYCLWCWKPPFLSLLKGVLEHTEVVRCLYHTSKYLDLAWSVLHNKYDPPFFRFSNLLELLWIPWVYCGLYTPFLLIDTLKILHRGFLRGDSHRSWFDWLVKNGW